MARAFLELIPMHRVVLVHVFACLYASVIVVSGVVGALTSIAQSFPRKEHTYSRVRVYYWLLAYKSADLVASRGLMMGYYACGTVPVCTFFVFGIKLGKWGFDGCTFVGIS